MNTAESGPDAELASLTRAVALEPDSATAHFALANGWYLRNAFESAVEGYQKAIALKSDFAAAHCNLAMAYRSLGRLEESTASCKRAIEIEPASYVAHNSLGLTLQRMGRMDEAAACFRRAIAEEAGYAEAHTNLGVILGDRGQYGDAESCFRSAINARPELPEPYYNLGCALGGLHRLEEAVAAFEAALARKPDYWQACVMKGLVLTTLGRLAAALDCCVQAVQLMPDAAEAHHSLGLVLRESGRANDAIVSFERAIALKPDYAEAFNDMAIAYQHLGQFDKAVANGRRAIEINGAFPQAHCGLGIALAEMGLVEEALPELRRAVELKPDYEAAHSSALFFLNYSSRHEPTAVLAEHQRWAKARANRFAVHATHAERDRAPGRRLRIGYVSPDFRQHSVSFFLTPLLARHDHREFEVFCYSDVRQPDGITEQLQGYSDGWRNIAGLSDDQVCAKVQEDGIDILMDLALHSGSNRMLVFARKPAPVQATWLGYAGTTGLTTIDYKITDPHLDPPGDTEAFHSEKLFRLPDCYWCYTPPPGHPEVSALPVLTRGAVTFCAFQNLAKVSDQAVALWSRVLAAVPHSRLAIKARGVGGATTQERLLSMFSAQGVGNERLILEDWDNMDEYLNRFSVTDIALDTTPFAGGTTTCHALWMGVPIVTLAGKSALGRMGASILQNLGLPELIADSPGDYVKVAARLAGDPRRLTELRQGLRERMQRSPLTDAGRFTANLEAAYRAMWSRWCGAE